MDEFPYKMKYIIAVALVIACVQGFSRQSFGWRARSYQTSTCLTMSAVPTSTMHGPSYKVSNLERSVSFYTKVLGMKVVEENKAKGVAKMVMDDDAAAMSIELQAANGAILIGDAYSGIGIRVPNAATMFQAVESEGGKVLLDVGDFAYAASLIPDEDEMRNTPVRYGRLSDPDGYKIEVREDKKMSSSSRKLFKMVLNVLDIEESVAFYRDVLGMNVLRRRSNVYGIPKDASMCAFIGYSDEATGSYLELHYQYAIDKLDMGNGYLRSSFHVPNNEEVANKLMDKVLQGAGKALEVTDDNTIVVRDPSDFPVLLV